jgi:hypothetical protein
MAESLQSYLTTKTWLRAEWEAVQSGQQTEGGFVPDATQRTTYEQYLKNAGFKNEAEAMAKRAKEDAEGTQFGEIQSRDVKKRLAERQVTPEYAAELDAAGARARAEEAKRIALLSKGYITGQEPVYIPGTPENKAFWEAAINKARATGTVPEPPDAYLDAQAFAARYELYNRYGATSPTYNSWDDAKKQYVTLPNPYYNEKVLVPVAGMGNQWYKLERAKWETVVPGVGSTEATETAQLAMESFFANTVPDASGNPNPAGQRFFMRTPGDITNTGAGTPTPAGKTVVSTTKDASGNTITQYSDGSSTTTNKTTATGNMDATTKALIQSLEKQITDLSKQVTTNTAAETAAKEKLALEEKQRKENALASLTSRFSKYGLESLVPKIKELIINGSTESTIALELAETPEYLNRFKANTERLKKGLSVLDPGTYIGMEDSYRQALRAYGLKQFDTDEYVSQFISNDISANELSNRIVTAVQRIQNADPAITKQLKDFYNIGENDLVAYVLDPNQQFQKIERQVQTAEIGVAAARQGINVGVQVADQLAAQGVTQAEAQKGYATIADILPDAKKLSDIYGTTLEGYDLGQAEQEVFNQLASAQRRRQKLTQREIAAFGGSSGTNKTSLTTSSVGQF